MPADRHCEERSNPEVLNINVLQNNVIGNGDYGIKQPKMTMFANRHCEARSNPEMLNINVLQNSVIGRSPQLAWGSNLEKMTKTIFC